MNKDLKRMSEQELLAELVADRRRAETRERIKLGLMAALLLLVLVLALIYLPRISATLRSVDTAMAQVQSVVDEINAIGADKLAETVENIDAAAQGLREIVEAIGSAGLEGLQQSLKDLSDFGEAFGSLFGR